mmetsp:Transcript_53845/g.80352  ORF Transcript_53845/g.80352 Transcript_53845/m.80352 type:complete len:206 (-) Transcript_53845:1070-1687(-)
MANVLQSSLARLDFSPLVSGNIVVLVDDLVLYPASLALGQTVNSVVHFLTGAYGKSSFQSLALVVSTQYLTSFRCPLFASFLLLWVDYRCVIRLSCTGHLFINVSFRIPVVQAIIKQLVRLQRTLLSNQGAPLLIIGSRRVWMISRWAILFYMFSVAVQVLFELLLHHNEPIVLSFREGILLPLIQFLPYRSNHLQMSMKSATFR